MHGHGLLTTGEGDLVEAKWINGHLQGAATLTYKNRCGREQAFFADGMLVTPPKDCPYA